jgi:pimeloyl-ACP methyl ester carboxylesterase
MKKQLLINQKKINHTDSGSGIIIVLLHGYLESLEIWKEFSSELSNYYRVICFDIPGHGERDIRSEQHTMQDLATLLYNTLNELDINKCFMIGHSMGGYLTLMFHVLFSQKLLGFALFHSHPFADTEETKKKRKREIDLVNDGKKDLIAKTNIPNAFADTNLEKFKEDINHAIQIAVDTPAEGIIANLKAMMNRPDLSESLANTSLPFLFIVGEKDNYIDFKTVVPKVKLPEHSNLCILKNSGHMGFIEEKNKSLQGIIDFIHKL